jgi:hypothetical protein
MLNLAKFFQEKIIPLPYHDRFVTILEIDDVLVVNLDCLFERDYSLRGVDQLIYLLHKSGQGKRFMFLSEDGSIIQLSNAKQVISNIVDIFKLTSDTCALVCREKTDIPNVTVIVRESVPHWCRVLYPVIKDIEIPQVPFSKKFAVWFHRGTFYRLMIARHLQEKYKDDAYISYQEPGMLHDWKLKEYWQEELTWANANTPIIYDQLFPMRVYDHEMIVGSNRKPYNEYFLEIIVETDCITTEWITEKTVKNLYIGKPFLVMGGHGILEKIKTFGFKTFSPWIDETYDTIENNYLRLQAIKKEIDRLATKSLEELSQIHQELIPTLEHNRQTYGKYINSR